MLGDPLLQAMAAGGDGWGVISTHVVSFRYLLVIDQTVLQCLYLLVKSSPMDTLRTYLGTLAPDDQAAFAVKAGTTIGYLRKALSKRTRFDGALARRLDEQSGGQVSRSELRPDIFDPPGAAYVDPDAGRIVPVEGA